MIVGFEFVLVRHLSHHIHCSSYFFCLLHLCIYGSGIFRLTFFSLQESNLLNPHCLSAGTDSLYLQSKPVILTLNYPRKHTNCAISLQERQFPIPLRDTEKHQFY